jgi:hypothetical protein
VGVTWLAVLLVLLAYLARPYEKIKLTLQGDLLLPIARELSFPPLSYEFLAYHRKTDFFSHRWHFAATASSAKYPLKAYPLQSVTGRASV